MEFIKFLTGNKGKVLPKELKGFNWGAFLLLFIWGAKYRIWITFLAIPLIWFQMPLALNWFLLFLLQLYCGIKGNEMAYQTDWWMKPRDFRTRQRYWSMAGVGIHTALPLILLVIVAMFLKNPDNPVKLAENSLCVIANDKLKKGLANTDITAEITSYQMAKQISDEFKNTRPDGSTVIFNIKNGSEYIDVYRITIEKPQNRQCSIDAKNCKISSTYVVPDGIFPIGDCYFYFDSKKQIVPDERTEQSLKKGFNIFKYL